MKQLLSSAFDEMPCEGLVILQFSITKPSQGLSLNFTNLISDYMLRNEDRSGRIEYAVRNQCS